ncbi:MAG: DsbA family protein [Coxiellaceae bacterium]|nr:DsbA family protein [Coxiellaceae bacterium]
MFKILFAVGFIFYINVGFSETIAKNSNRDVTLVEYYDYECPHCRRMEPVIESLEAQYPNLHVVYRVTPLLTPASRVIASVALAVAAQNKKSGAEIHSQLMQLNATPTMNDALYIANTLGFSSNALLNSMQNQRIQNQINQNITSAKTRAINGAIYLPILVFTQSNGQGQSIVLTGEQPPVLLSAIVKQLGDYDVQMVKNKKEAG